MGGSAEADRRIAGLQAELAARQIEVDGTELAILAAMRRVQEPLEAALAAAKLSDVPLEVTPDYGSQPR